MSFADQQNERTTCIVRSARTWPRPGAQVAPQQSLILPPGCWHDPHSFFGTQVDIHTLTGEQFAKRKRGTTVLVPLARNPRSRRQLEVIPGELVSRQTDWSGAGYRDDRKQILRAGASGRLAARDDRRARRQAASPVEAAQPRIHEGMYWGAVGPRPFTSGKRTRHDLVTPDRL